MQARARVETVLLLFSRLSATCSAIQVCVLQFVGSTQDAGNQNSLTGIQLPSEVSSMSSPVMLL